MKSVEGFSEKGRGFSEKGSRVFRTLPEPPVRLSIFRLPERAGSDRQEGRFRNAKGLVPEGKRAGLAPGHDLRVRKNVKTVVENDGTVTN